MSALLASTSVVAFVASCTGGGPRSRPLTQLARLRRGSTEERDDTVPARARLAAIALMIGFMFGVVAGPVVGVVCGLAVCTIPLLVRRVGRWRDEKAFEQAIPVLLDETARGLRAGLSPVIAIVDAANACGPPFPAALRPLTDRLGMGEELDRALQGWAGERQSRSVALFAGAVSVGRTVGSVNARAVDAVAATLREQLSLRSEIAVHVAQAQISAAVMTIAPLMFCALLVLGNASASSFLVGTSWGWACIAMGLSLDSVGALWMLRIARRAAQP